MSTQQPPAQQVDPSRAFERYVWTNPGVCNNCFSRIKADWRRVRDGVRGYDIEDHDEQGERTVRDEEGRVIDTEPAGTHGALSTYRARTTCGHCGSIGGRAPDDPLPRRAALRRVPDLVERLREQGVTANEYAVRYAIREFKSYSELQGLDRELFERAAMLGIKHA